MHAFIWGMTDITRRKMRRSKTSLRIALLGELSPFATYEVINLALDMMPSIL
jgi:hypothetical protein